MSLDLETRPFPTGELATYHRNPRRGNVDAIAESLATIGQYRPIVVNAGTLTGRPLEVLAGNHTLLAARQLGWDAITGATVDVDDETAARIVAADNRTADLGDYDLAQLLELLADLPDLTGTGYTGDDLARLTESAATPIGSRDLLTEPDAIPDEPEPQDVRSVLGDLWLLGPHRLLCGDSTEPAAVQRVTGGEQVTLIHADPPYGMGKEADGVLNDNLYRENLDAFQMQWWRAWRAACAENGSAYIWGTAPDLWRLWYRGGLADEQGLLVRNEIVWDKGSGMGMASDGHHSYATATERCLFLMLGQQFLGNQNLEDYWEGYEPLRSWLEREVDKAGWTKKDVNRITGTQMAGHWLSRSQFMPIGSGHYAVLQRFAEGRAFTLDYDALFAEVYPGIRDSADVPGELAAMLRESRTFFDNTHDTMCDVWRYARVTGEERHGHATPKPVAMVERALLSSTQADDLVGAPFGGSGPEFIAAHRTGRRVAAVELSPQYVDVICRRWQEATGTLPVLESTGEAVDFTKPAKAVA